MITDYKAEAEAIKDQLVDWRRDVHRYPELGFEEVRTADLVAEYLQHLGCRVYTGVAKTGVIGLIQGLHPGPTVMLRFDMDALPIQEENKVVYASETPGVMHACGHDAHVSIGLGTATLLQRHRQDLAGTVKLVFQPGEEGMKGAQVMVQEGAVEDYGPRPDVAYGIHVWNQSPLGQVVVTSGPMLAAADRWSLKVKGRGGHGALPHQTADPVVAAGQIVTALQSIVSRNVDPQRTAVVTVGTINGGTAFNIIPAEVTLTGTVRTFEPQVREQVLRRLQTLCQAVAEGMDVETEWNLEPLTPAVINDAAATAVIRQVAQDFVGEENVIGDFRTMGSEDMAYFLQQVPGSYVFVGSANSEAGLDFPHHNPRFDIDEDVLPLAVGILAETTIRFMQGSLDS